MIDLTNPKNNALANRMRKMIAELNAYEEILRVPIDADIRELYMQGEADLIIVAKISLMAVGKYKPKMALPRPPKDVPYEHIDLATIKNFGGYVLNSVEWDNRRIELGGEPLPNVGDPIGERKLKANPQYLVK